MHTLYLLSVIVHVLAAITWIGGIAFLMLVVVPWLRTSGGAVDAARFLRETGARFRNVGWTCFALLIPTGVFQLYVRGVRLSSFTDGAWLASSAGRVIVAKLVVFALVLGLSAVHDFVIGPRATTAIAASPTSVEAARLRRQASWLGRSNALCAFVLVALAVMIVRGAP